MSFLSARALSIGRSRVGETFVAFVWASLLSSATVVHAQQDQPELTPTNLPAAGRAPAEVAPFTPDLALHGTLTAALLGISAIFQIAIIPQLPGGLSCEPLSGQRHCDPSSLNELDRSVVNNSSPGMAAISDGTLLASVLLPPALLVLDAWLSETRTPLRHFLNDLLVYGEAVGTAFFIYVLTANAVRRPRPIQYTTTEPIETYEAQLSFPSGHVVIATSAATAFATMFGMEHPESPWRHVIYVGAAALSLVTAFGRVADARHFYTDVFAALVLGGAAGALVPYLHGRGVSNLAVAPASGVVAGRPTYGLQVVAGF